MHLFDNKIRDMKAQQAQKEKENMFKSLKTGSLDMFFMASSNQVGQTDKVQLPNELQFFEKVLSNRFTEDITTC